MKPALKRGGAPEVMNSSAHRSGCASTHFGQGQRTPDIQVWAFLEEKEKREIEIPIRWGMEITPRKIRKNFWLKLLKIIPGNPRLT